MRMLLFQLLEWNEDFKEWGSEIHIKCTYNGTIQIKILFPFYLKPWRKSKLRSHHIDHLMKKIKKQIFVF
ncbi:hypothetical protein AMTRI_Chr08g161740 [Amborella trichopoda]